LNGSAQERWRRVVAGCTMMFLHRTVGGTHGGVPMYRVCETMG